jgi:hypothetical protein
MRKERGEEGEEEEDGREEIADSSEGWREVSGEEELEGTGECEERLYELLMTFLEIIRYTQEHSRRMQGLTDPTLSYERQRGSDDP